MFGRKESILEEVGVVLVFFSYLFWLVSFCTQGQTETSSVNNDEEESAEEQVS